MDGTYIVEVLPLRHSLVCKHLAQLSHALIAHIEYEKEEWSVRIRLESFWNIDDVEVVCTDRRVADIRIVISGNITMWTSLYSLTTDSNSV